MQPLNEALSNSRSGPSPPMAQPMMYHDLDLANIQREDNAEKNSSNRNNNAGKAQLEPNSSVVEEITYPRVSHGKPPFHLFYLAHVIEQPNLRIPNPQYLQLNFCFDFFNDSENTF